MQLITLPPTTGCEKQPFSYLLSKFSYIWLVTHLTVTKSLLTLDYHCLANDLLPVSFNLMYKIYHNLTKFVFNDYFQYHKTKYNLRRHGWTLQSLFFLRIFNLISFFVNRISPISNNLHDIVVSALSLFLFKKHLSFLKTCYIGGRCNVLTFEFVYFVPSH